MPGQTFQAESTESRSALMKLKVLKFFKVLAPGNSLRKRTGYSLALVRLILVPVIVLAVYCLFRMGSIVDQIVVHLPSRH
jgi:hypothetical protein